MCKISIENILYLVAVLILYKYSSLDMLCIDERIKFIRDRLQADIDQILHRGGALLAEADSDVSRLETITYGIVSCMLL